MILLLLKSYDQHYLYYHYVTKHNNHLMYLPNEMGLLPGLNFLELFICVPKNYFIYDII